MRVHFEPGVFSLHSISGFQNRGKRGSELSAPRILGVRAAEEKFGTRLA